MLLVTVCAPSIPANRPGRNLRATIALVGVCVMMYWACTTP
jgi:hypothetical protein